MSVILMKDLLEAGVHFGHQAKKWDPRMAQFIYTERNGIHIIDLQQTVRRGEVAYDFIRDGIADGGKILFVGTKRQAQESVKNEALRCQQFYVTQRWLGGMLTNFSTVRKSILRLKKLEKMEIDSTFDSITKKEQIKLTKEKIKLEKNLGGIKEMTKLPDIIFIIDPIKEHIAVKEARRMRIPIVSVVDSNCNPYLIDYPIPGNDDAIRSINLFMRVLADTVIEGETIGSKAVAESLGKDKEQHDEQENTKNNAENIVKTIESTKAIETTEDNTENTNAEINKVQDLPKETEILNKQETQEPIDKEQTLQEQSKEDKLENTIEDTIKNTEDNIQTENKISAMNTDVQEKEHDKASDFRNTNEDQDKQDTDLNETHITEEK